MKIVRNITAALASVALAGVAMIAAAPGASAAVCGFAPVTSNNIGGGDDGSYEAGVYKHCGSDRPVLVMVTYTYTSETMCVSPGETTITAHPDKGAIRNIKGMGEAC